LLLIAERSRVGARSEPSSSDRPHAQSSPTSSRSTS
jgi:hypothetical protein